MTRFLYQALAMILLLFCTAIGTGCRLIPPANHADPNEYYMPERQGDRRQDELCDETDLVSDGPVQAAQPYCASSSAPNRPSRREPQDDQRRNDVYEASLGQKMRYHGIDQPYFRYDMPLEISHTHLAPTQVRQSCCLPQYLSNIPLSPGDRVRIRIIDGDLFNGDYEVNLDNTLQLPFLTPIPVAGMTLADVEQQIKQALVSQGFFLSHIVQVSVRHLLWGVAQVHVSGAVFQPGLHLVNRRTPDDRIKPISQSGGDYPPDRTLTSALRAAGGIRPDANIQHITLIRGHRKWEIDFTGIINGDFVTDPPLATGDRIVVNSTGRFQPHLIRPSMITPPGIQVHMSNLTVPADSNALSNIDSDTTKFPYGTRLLQAMVSANCVGGTDATNANRYVVLASYNPLTGKSEVIERSVEGLIRQANRDDYNPYLLPGDALACYDSVITGIRDVARTISDVLGPLQILGIVPK